MGKTAYILLRALAAVFEDDIDLITAMFVNELHCLASLIPGTSAFTFKFESLNLRCVVEGLNRIVAHPQKILSLAHSWLTHATTALQSLWYNVGLYHNVSSSAYSSGPLKPRESNLSMYLNRAGRYWCGLPTYMRLIILMFIANEVYRFIELVEKEIKIYFTANHAQDVGNYSNLKPPCRSISVEHSCNIHKTETAASKPEIGPRKLTEYLKKDNPAEISAFDSVKVSPFKSFEQNHKSCTSFFEDDSLDIGFPIALDMCDVESSFIPRSLYDSINSKTAPEFTFPDSLTHSKPDQCTKETLRWSLLDLVLIDIDEFADNFRKFDLGLPYTIKPKDSASIVSISQFIDDSYKYVNGLHKAFAYCHEIFCKIRKAVNTINETEGKLSELDTTNILRLNSRMVAFFGYLRSQYGFEYYKLLNDMDAVRRKTDGLSEYCARLLKDPRKFVSVVKQTTWYFEHKNVIYSRLLFEAFGIIRDYNEVRERLVAQSSVERALYQKESKVLA